MLLPADPDGSARELRARIGAAARRRARRSWWPTRSAAHGGSGRPTSRSGPPGWSRSTSGTDRPDAYGRDLRVTSIAVADAAAAAADLARAKDSRQPAVLVRGLERYVTADDGPGAAALRRPRDQDLFR